MRSMSSDSDDELPPGPESSFSAVGALAVDPPSNPVARSAPQQQELERDRDTLTFPHLVNLADASCFVPITGALVRLGEPDAEPPQDIELVGEGVEEEHCMFEWPGGVAAGPKEAPVKLHPIGKARRHGEDTHTHTHNFFLVFIQCFFYFFS